MQTKYSIPKQITIKSLEANAKSNISATYYLLLKKFVRLGGFSIADARSKNFEKTIFKEKRKLLLKPKEEVEQDLSQTFKPKLNKIKLQTRHIGENFLDFQRQSKPGRSTQRMNLQRLNNETAGLSSLQYDQTFSTIKPMLSPVLSSDRSINLQPEELYSNAY